MSNFIDMLKTSKGLMTYELLRNAVYMAGLPFSDEDVDVLYEEYVKTGEVPDYILDLMEESGYYYES